MGSDTSAMDRKQFLKYLLNKAKSFSVEVISEVAEPLYDVKKTADNFLTIPLIAQDEYENVPKLITSVQPPLFLVGEKGKNLTAVSAVCKNDGLLMSYLTQEGCLYCPMCGSKHHLDEENGQIKTDLPVFPLTAKEGYIYKL